MAHIGALSKLKLLDFTTSDEHLVPVTCLISNALRTTPHDRGKFQKKGAVRAKRASCYEPTKQPANAHSTARLCTANIIYARAE
jgi:hypothetical protein